MDFNNNNNMNNNNGYHGPNGYNNPNGFNNPNGNPNPYGYQYVPPVKQPGSSLQTAAMVLGILSIVTACIMTVYPPFIFGGLAIIFAILSKGSIAKLQQKAKIGVICSIIGLVLNCFIIAGSFKTIFENPEMTMEVAAMYDDIIEQMYGVPSEDILGESMEDTMAEMFEAFGIDE